MISFSALSGSFGWKPQQTTATGPSASAGGGSSSSKISEGEGNYKMASEQAVLTSALKLIRSPTETIKFAHEVLTAPASPRSSPNSSPTGSAHSINDSVSSLRSEEVSDIGAHGTANGDAHVEGPVEEAKRETNRVQPEAAARRYLALIVKTEPGGGREEAAIIIFRRPTAPIVVTLIPIYSNFELVIEQKKGNNSPVSAKERARFKISFTAPTLPPSLTPLTPAPVSPTNPSNIASTPTPFPRAAPIASAYYTIFVEDINLFSPTILEIKRLHSSAIVSQLTSDPPTPWEGRKSHGWLEGRVPGHTQPAFEEANGKDGSVRDDMDEKERGKFDSISRVYSMRKSAGEGVTSLRKGLSAATWTPTSSGPPSPRLSPNTPRLSVSTANGRPSIGTGSYSGTTLAGDSSLTLGAPPISPALSLKEKELDPDDTIATDERGRWIVDQMKEREKEFVKPENINIFVNTFNVNDKVADDKTDLSGLLEASKGAELLVFGFQEFDLSKEALVRYTSWREDQWRFAIERGLGDRRGEYEKLHSKQLVGALILIYVKSSVKKYISNIESCSLATGILGLIANKGATAIRLKYKDTYLTFLNAHLAAFTEQTAKRNQESRDIAKGLYFSYEEEKAAVGRDPWTPNLKPEAERVPGFLGVYDSHHLIWLGDLNYRIDLPRSDVLRMVENKEYEMLARFDQLKIQKQHALAWTDFEEAPLDFAPTFKFDVGTQDYDTSEKQRVPSWTDRVLWLSVHEGSIKPLSYTSHPDIVLSDHKPVSVMLSTPISTVIPEKRARIQREVMAELDRFDNDSLPDVKILPGPAVQFDTVEYLKPMTQQIEVVNVGKVIAQWSFVLKPGATTLSEPWLHLSPTSGLILPGEKSVVTLTINVDNDTAPNLNFMTDLNALSDLLIISIEKKDLFLSVAARNYLPTSFANTLTRLAKLGKPIRTAKPAELDIIREDTTDEVIEKGTIPRELWRMLNFLAEHAVDMEDVFLVPGDPALIELIRECLDTGEPFPLDRLFPTPPVIEPEPDDVAEAPLEPRESEIDIGAIQLSPTKTRNGRLPATAIPAQVKSSSHGHEGSHGEEAYENMGIHSMADCCIRFLESLAEPVVTYDVYAKALRVEKRSDAYAIVEALPSINENTLLYIAAFLRVLVAQTPDVDEREARTDRLAVVFSSVLMRPHPTATPDWRLPPASIPRLRKAFILHLLSREPKVPAGELKGR